MENGNVQTTKKGHGHEKQRTKLARGKKAQTNKPKEARKWAVYVVTG